MRSRPKSICWPLDCASVVFRAPPTRWLEPNIIVMMSEVSRMTRHHTNRKTQR